MPTQPENKFRSLVLATAAVLVLLLGIALAWTAFKQPSTTADQPASTEQLVTSEKPAAKQSPKKPAPPQKITFWDPGEDHPVSQPTDFYAGTGVPEIEINEEITPQEHQINHRAFLWTMVLDSGDLLADHCLNGVKHHMTEQQVHDARLMGKQYDAQLKDIRRQRAAILEQAGITIKDPEEELALIRLKAFHLFSEARTKICQKILSKEQRAAIYEEFLDKKAQKEALKTKTSSTSNDKLN